MRAPAVLLGLCIGTVLLSSCGGSGGGAAASAGAPANPTDGGGQVSGAESAAPTGQSAADELPTFMMDFDRVCKTQGGFPGAAAYDATPGLHPVALFTDFGTPPTLIESGSTLPAGWTVTQDSDFTDNSELAVVQLVACSRRAKATPNGTKCDFKANDGGEPLTLELTDTVYELTVYAAATGKQVGEPQKLEASSTECPFIATFKEGDTQFLIEPTDDQYITALKGIVAPGQ